MGIFQLEILKEIPRLVGRNYFMASEDDNYDDHVRVSEGKNSYFGFLIWWFVFCV